MTRTVKPQSDEMDSDNSGGFVFTHNESDGSITLVNDPLDRWSIDYLPRGIHQRMVSTYGICVERLAGIQPNESHYDF